MEVSGNDVRPAEMAGMGNGGRPAEVAGVGIGGSGKPAETTGAE